MSYTIDDDGIIRKPDGSRMIMRPPAADEPILRDCENCGDEFIVPYTRTLQNEWESAPQLCDACVWEAFESKDQEPGAD